MKGESDARLDLLVQSVGASHALYTESDGSSDAEYAVFVAGREEAVCGVQVLDPIDYGGDGTTFLPWVWVRDEDDCLRHGAEQFSRAAAMGFALRMATEEGWIKPPLRS